MNSFAERLIHARTARGLTQAQLAAASGLSQSAIANYESGSRRTSKKLLPLAAALQVDAQWLFNGKGPMHTPLYGTQPSSPARGAMPQLREHAIKGTAWPFIQIQPNDYWSLDAASRTLIENTVAALITSLKK